MVKFLCSILCLLVVTMSAGAQSEFLVADSTGDKVVRFHWPSPTPIDHFVGNGISPLDAPRGLALPGDGYLYVASFRNDSVLRYYALTGEYVYPPFVPSGAGGLDGAYDLVFGPDGQLYVCSYYTDRILRYNGTTGAFIDIFVAPGLGGLDAPISLIFDHDGNLVVCSHENSKVLKYNSDGTFNQEFDTSQTGLVNPEKVIISADGTLYICGGTSDSVVKITPQGQAVLLVPPGGGGLDGPEGLAIDPDGNLLVAMVGGNGAILKYNLAGQFLGQLIVGTAGGMSGDPATILFLPDPKECVPDIDENGVLDLFDFLEFVNLFNAGC